MSRLTGTTEIRPVSWLAIALVIAVAFLVGSRTADTGPSPPPPPDVLVFPTQTVASRAVGVRGPATGTNTVTIEGTLCDVGDEPVDTEVTLAVERPGGPKAIITPEPLIQVRQPGCAWALRDCPTDLRSLIGPVEATECGPPFVNQIPDSIRAIGGCGWRVTGVVRVTDGTARDATITSEPFCVTQGEP